MTKMTFVFAGRLLREISLGENTFLVRPSIPFADECVLILVRDTMPKSNAPYVFSQ